MSNKMSFEQLMGRYRGLLERAGHGSAESALTRQLVAEAVTPGALQQRWRELYAPALASMAPDVLDAFETAEAGTDGAQAARARASAAALTAAHLTMSALELEFAILAKLAQTKEEEPPAAKDESK